MFCFSNKKVKDEAKIYSKNIELQIIEGIRMLSFTSFIVLLGNECTGRNTLFNQIKLCNKIEISYVERLRNKENMFPFIVFNLLFVLREFGTSGLKFEKEESLESARLIVRDSSKMRHGVFSSETTMALERLKDDHSFMDFVTSNFNQAFFCTSYFLGDFGRLIDENVTLSDTDVLTLKCAKADVVEETVFHGENTFRFVRASPPRSSINKWIPWFQNVDAVIFVADLLGYDTYVDSDNEKFNLRDDMEFFSAVCNGTWFDKTTCSHVFLILNKFDLFQRKLPTSSLRMCFPDYRGTSDPFEAVEFIKRRFEGLNKCPLKTVHTQVMSAISDTEAVTQLIQNVIHLTAKHPPSKTAKK